MDIETKKYFIRIVFPLKIETSQYKDYHSDIGIHPTGTIFYFGITRKDKRDKECQKKLKDLNL